MRFKTNLVVGAVFAALLGFVYFHEIKGGEERQAAADKAKMLAEFSDHEAKRLVLDRGDTLVVLEKDAGDWRLTAPVAAAADGDAVERYLRNLRETERERVVEDSAAVAADGALRAKYGLEGARLKIRLETTEAALDTFVFGADSPTERFAYMRRGGANPEIFTVRAWRYDNLNKGVFDLRDRRVLPFAKDEAVRVSLQAADGDAVVLEKQAGSWRLLEPVEAEADAGAVDGLLGALEGAEAQAYADEAPDAGALATYGLAPAATVEVALLVGEERAEKRLAVGGLATGKRYYARDAARGAVFEADSSVVLGLLKTAADLRDRKPVRFERDAVDDVTLEGRAGRLRALRDTAGVWSIVEPEAREAKSWRFNSLLTELEGVEVSRFVADGVEDFAAHGLGAPALEIRLTAGGAEVGRYAFGAPEGEEAALRVFGMPSVFAVDAAVFEEVDLGLEDLAQENAAPAAEAPAENGE